MMGADTTVRVSEDTHEALNALRGDLTHNEMIQVLLAATGGADPSDD
jgi:hypothetical protein